MVELHSIQSHESVQEGAKCLLSFYSHYVDHRPDFNFKWKVCNGLPIGYYRCRVNA